MRRKKIFIYIALIVVVTIALTILPFQTLVARDRDMVCSQVWINEDGAFEFIFLYEYADNNWVKIYDMQGNEVYSLDMPYDNAHFVVSLPDGFYTVKTYNDDMSKPIQEFVIGKPFEATSLDLKNIEYKIDIVPGGVAKLENGSFSVEAAPGSASKIEVKLTEAIAYGDLTTDGMQDAAVVLWASGGGSGSFYYLSAAIDKAGNLQGTNSILLGDRIKIEGVTIDSGIITVKYLDRTASQSFAEEPTVEVIKKFKAQGGNLVAAVAESPKITDISWQWEKFESSDDSVVTVNDPTKYTLILNIDGSVSIKADCNVAVGTYTIQDSGLIFSMGPTTLAYCDEDSMDTQYLSYLENVATYVLSEGKLYLNLKADAGNMVFRSGGKG